VLDAIIDGATTPPRARRSLLRALEAPFADVIDDRIGSRVGARCWAAADPYLKVRNAGRCNPRQTPILFDLGEARTRTTPSRHASRGLAIRTVLHAWTRFVLAAAQTRGVA
jgi:hypothetical protein